MRKLLLLGFIPIIAYGQVNLDAEKLEIDTYYAYSGVERTLTYYMPLEASDIERCEVVITHFQRNEVVYENTEAPAPSNSNELGLYASVTFIPPATGHYIVEVRCCTENACSDFVDSRDLEDRGWWLFTWVSPPTFD